MADAEICKAHDCVSHYSLSPALGLSFLNEDIIIPKAKQVNVSYPIGRGVFFTPKKQFGHHFCLSLALINLLTSTGGPPVGHFHHNLDREPCRFCEI